MYYGPKKAQKNKKLFHRSLCASRVGRKIPTVLYITDLLVRGRSLLQ